MDDDRCGAALALLEAHHTFPGPFTFRVVTRPAAAPTIVAAVRAAVGEGPLDVAERRSKGGNYLALHLTGVVSGAEHVLEVFDVLRAVDGVIAVL